MKSIKTILEFAPAAALSIGLAHFGVVFIAHADNDSNITHNGTMHVVISPPAAVAVRGSRWLARKAMTSRLRTSRMSPA